MDSFASDNVCKFPSIICPLCSSKEVSKSTYYFHYKKFYGKQWKSWQLESKQAPSKPKQEPDFDFQTVESEEIEDNIGVVCELVETLKRFEFMDSQSIQLS